MTRNSVAVALALMLGGGLALAPRPGTAAANPAIAARPLPSAVVPVANWHHPYSNINRRNDAGNNTGDAMTERLNEQQLNRNYQGGNPPMGHMMPQGHMMSAPPPPMEQR